MSEMISPAAPYSPYHAQPSAHLHAQQQRQQHHHHHHDQHHQHHQHHHQHQHYHHQHQHQHQHHYAQRHENSAGYYQSRDGQSQTPVTSAPPTSSEPYGYNPASVPSQYYDRHAGHYPAPGTSYPNQPHQGTWNNGPSRSLPQSSVPDYRYDPRYNPHLQYADAYRAQPAFSGGHNTSAYTNQHPNDVTVYRTQVDQKPPAYENGERKSPALEIHNAYSNKAPSASAAMNVKFLASGFRSEEQQTSLPAPPPSSQQYQHQSALNQQPVSGSAMYAEPMRPSNAQNQHQYYQQPPATSNMNYHSSTTATVTDNFNTTSPLHADDSVNKSPEFSAQRSPYPSSSFTVSRDFDDRGGSSTTYNVQMHVGSSHVSLSAHVDMAGNQEGEPTNRRVPEGHSSLYGVQDYAAKVSDNSQKSSDEVANSGQNVKLPSVQDMLDNN